MTKVRLLPYGEMAEKEYDVRLAMEEASRCLLCEDAPCSRDCPAGTDPGKFIRSIRFRNFKGAAKTIRENNILGAACAGICPHDRLCEKACSRCGIDRPIQIGKLQTFAMAQERIFGMKILEAGADCGKKVLCIGAGPASLTVAAELAKCGVSVTVVDEHDRIGGILRYGISPSRLSDETIDQDVEVIKGLGVKFELGRRVHADELATLKQQYDAIFVGVGLSASKMIPNLKGASLAGCETALQFLSRARSSQGKIDALGNVVIIGGGDVAMDCASTAKQLGARSVYVTFIETLETMPANKKELDHVITLGVPVVPAFKPIEILGETKVEGVKLVAVEGNSKIELDADTVIFAVGQKRTEDYAHLEAGQNVFLGGDAINGGKTVVEAVKNGKEVAVAIAQLLRI